MIKSLTGVAVRFFKENKFIAISSIASVAISISIILTMALFISNAKQSLLDEVQLMFGEMDLAVGFNAEQERVIDAEFLESLISMEPIKESSAILLSRLYVEELGGTVYTIGAENDPLAKSRYHFSESLTEDDVILNKRLAETLDVQLGEEVVLENRSYIVKEITSDLEAAGPVTDTLILSRKRVQQLDLEKNGVHQEATYILMELKEEQDALELAAQLKGVDPELRIDIAEEDEFVKTNLNLLNQFIAVLSVLVLILTSLFIISNFEVFLYKYKNQLAIMRALGATTKQVFAVIFIQASLINLFGAIGAFIVVLASHTVIQDWMAPLFSVSSTQNDFDFLLALGVITGSVALIELFMLIPAYRSSKILPLTVMQDNETIDFHYQVFYRYAGFGLLGTGLIFILLGLAIPRFVILILFAALFLLIGLFLLLPIALTPLMYSLLPIIKRLFGNTSFITVKNLIPQVRKNILVVFIIGGMMILAVFGSSFIQTIKNSDELYVKKSYPTEIVLTANPYNDQIAVNPLELEKAVEELPDVKNVSTYSRFHSGFFKQDGQESELIYAHGDLAAMEEQGILPATDKTEGPKMVIPRAIAETYDWQVGDKVELENEFLNLNQAYTIAGIVEELPKWGDAVVEWGSSENSPLFQEAFIEAKNEENALAQLEEVKRQFPGVTISSYSKAIEQSREMFAQRWSIFIVVIAVILFSVMLGVANTLINNIYSRRKEYAILRAISLSKKGIIQVILTQVMLYLIIGLLFGAIAGVLLTFTVSLVDTGTALYIDFQLGASLALAMILLTVLVFVPFTGKIASMPISEELTRDNK